MSHTRGPWRVGRPGSVVADHPVPGMRGSGDVAYYGGHLIAESVTASNAPILAAAPELLDALYITSNCAPITDDLARLADDAEITLGFTAADIRQIRAAIAKAKGCDCVTSGNVEKPKQHGADPHAKNCALYTQKESPL